MLVSESLALGAAACIALSGMLIAELKGRVDVIRLARWQMVAAVLMTGAAATVLGGWGTVGVRSFWLLAASSVFGIIIASTTYFSAIYLAGARMTALLFALASPFSLLLGYVALGETISGQQALGVLLVLAGIALAVGVRRRNTVPAVEVPAMVVDSANATAPAPAHDAGQAPPALPWLGIALGALTALGQALGSLLARPAMEAGVEPFTAMAVRSGVGAMFFVALLAVPALRKPYVFRRSEFGIAVTSAFFGTSLGMALLMAALATGKVGIVLTLSSLTPVMILPMVWIRSGVAPRIEAWLGAALAVAGTALISL